MKLTDTQIEEIYKVLITIGGVFPNGDKNKFLKYFKGTDIENDFKEWKFGGVLEQEGILLVKDGALFVSKRSIRDDSEKFSIKTRIQRAIERIIDPAYYVLSLKWTHKNDQFITLWGKHNSGYEYFLDMAGTYSEEDIKKEPWYYSNRENTLAIPIERTEKLAKKVNYDNKVGLILPNTFEVRKEFKIKLTDLKKSNRSLCPERKKEDLRI